MAEGRRGAARSEAARVAVLRATAELFAARGYDHLTIEGVAAQAGVAKQTIYRWWPSRSALVADCLFEGLLVPEGLDVPDTGDLRADLVAWLDGLLRFVGTPHGNALVRSLVAAAAENADVGRRLNEALGATSDLVTRLEAATGSADLRPGTPVNEVAAALLGAVVVHALQREPGDAEPADAELAAGLAERLVRAVLA